MYVFLSYADRDGELARQLAERLGAAGVSVWLDEREVEPGDNWADKLQTALKHADAMVVLLSPEAVRSRWVRREIDYALTTPRFEGRLVPVEVRPTKDMPWVLRRLSMIAHGTVERTAADIVKALTSPSRN